MLIFEIAAGIVLAVLALAYLPDILAAFGGLLIVGAGIILVAVVISAGWAGCFGLAILGALIAGAVWLQKKLHPHDWAAPVGGEEPSPASNVPGNTEPPAMHSGRRFNFSFSDGAEPPTDPVA